jgi:hypothetical protein
MSTDVNCDQTWRIRYMMSPAAIISGPIGPSDVIRPTLVMNCLVRLSFHARCIRNSTPGQYNNIHDYN